MCRNRYRSAAKSVGEYEGIGGPVLASDASAFVSGAACAAPGARL
jgi:hypothetical protein